MEMLKEPVSIAGSHARISQRQLFRKTSRRRNKGIRQRPRTTAQQQTVNSQHAPMHNRLEIIRQKRLDAHSRHVATWGNSAGLWKKAVLLRLERAAKRGKGTS